MTVENIDVSCANVGLRLSEFDGKPKDIENTLTRAAGILEEQGVYALFLYLFAREKRKGVAELSTLLERFCGVTGIAPIESTLRDLDEKLRDARDNKTKIKGKQRRQSSEEGVLLSEIRRAREEFFTKVGDLSKRLDDLLFARELLHAALLYGRYHAKARAAVEGRV